MRDTRRINRREFLKQTGAAAGVAVSAGASAKAARAVALIVNPDDPVATQPPAVWAAGELERSLVARGVPVRRGQRLVEGAGGDLSIFIAGARHSLAAQILRGARVPLPSAPESFALAPGKTGRSAVLLACGRDPRGLVYALLELADRVHYAPDPLAALALHQPISEKPLNAVRSANRCFESDVEDKPWFNDRAMWPPYLSMLAAQRFNRFSLTFGLGYDFPRHLRDTYLYFAYPFLVAPPGYNVRAAGLPDAERDHNLEMLRFISDQAAARGLDFQLGLWTHAYEWEDSPQANYNMQGLTAENHPAYCRDAIRALLVACPSINGITLRVHGESGIKEGSTSFWKTIFEGIVRAGRPIELNLHAKGIDQPMIDLALATGLPVTISPKYWAEHMGLPYQPSSIRELEMPHPNKKTGAYFGLSEGTRSFMRYSFGDLFKEDRRYGIFFRVFPGTQRALLWGNPAMAAADGRAANFCGSLGMDLFEPLSFKGRHGSGLPGGRCSYADASLNPKYDWEKFLYTYRVWGRHLYDPDADIEGSRRFLRQEFQAGAPEAENALSHASRILRLVTTAHLPSAANNNFWPEIYTNMSMLDASKNHIYNDTPAPKVFGAVSPLDPELFSTINDCAAQLLKNERDGKYSPLEVAQWLEDLADGSNQKLAEAKSKFGNPVRAALRRLAVDVGIQCGLGRFYAWKLRAGVLYALYQQTSSVSALQEAVNAYHRARASWADLAEHATGVYMADITYGIEPNLRGHWTGRLPQIDDDIADMEKLLERDEAQATAQGGRENSIPDAQVKAAIREALAQPHRPSAPCHHTPPRSFKPAEPLEISFEVEGSSGGEATLTARLNFRHVNQAENWLTTEMRRQKTRYSALIPAAYTSSPFPLQYYFDLRSSAREAWLYPGLGIALSDQPYFVVRRRSA